MVKIRVWGDYALFQRPEMVEDKCSYDIITPSAARGVMDCIYWHPGLVWVIDRIYIQNPIRFVDLGKENSIIALRDVSYVIEAHFDMTERANASDNAGKFSDIIKRRLTRRDWYKSPYLGTAEYPAHIEPWTGRNIKTANRGITDLGYILFDFDYSYPEPRPLYIRAVLHEGVLDLRNEQHILK